MIISDGYNGTPSGLKIATYCEDEGLFISTSCQSKLSFKSNEILLRLVKNSLLYITLFCKECSKLIHQSGMKRVV
jgi:deoxycytidylate deaminase